MGRHLPLTPEKPNWLAARLVCLLAQRGKLAAGLVAWLAVNFEVYQGGLLWNGSPNLHGYLGEVSSAFGLSLGLLNAGINVVWGGLLLGSLALLLWRPAGVKKNHCAS
jgi:hypothetical protein